MRYLSKLMLSEGSRLSASLWPQIRLRTFSYLIWIVRYSLFFDDQYHHSSLPTTIPILLYYTILLDLIKKEEDEVLFAIAEELGNLGPFLGN